jgi:hypothetical protein
MFGVLFLYPKHFQPKAIPFGPVIIKLRFTQPDFVFTLVHWAHFPLRVAWSVQRPCVKLLYDSQITKAPVCCPHSSALCTRRTSLPLTVPPRVMEPLFSSIIRHFADALLRESLPTLRSAARSNKRMCTITILPLSELFRRYVPHKMPKQFTRTMLVAIR